MGDADRDMPSDHLDRITAASIFAVPQMGCTGPSASPLKRDPPHYPQSTKKAPLHTPHRIRRFQFSVAADLLAYVRHPPKSHALPSTSSKSASSAIEAHKTIAELLIARGADVDAEALTR